MVIYKRGHVQYGEYLGNVQKRTYRGTEYSWELSARNTTIPGLMWHWGQQASAQKHAWSGVGREDRSKKLSTCELKRAYWLCDRFHPHPPLFFQQPVLCSHLSIVVLEVVEAVVKESGQLFPSCGLLFLSKSTHTVTEMYAFVSWSLGCRHES